MKILRLVFSAVLLTAAFARADLATFLAKPEPEGKWTLVSKSELGACEIITLKLKSQVWEGIAWEHDDSGNDLRLTLTANPAPKAIRVWRCTGPTKDLREARWESRTVDADKPIIEPRPTSGVVSFFADCDYEIDSIPFALCTQLRMVEAK